MFLVHLFFITSFLIIFLHSFFLPSLFSSFFFYIFPTFFLFIFSINFSLSFTLSFWSYILLHYLFTFSFLLFFSFFQNQFLHHSAIIIHFFQSFQNLTWNMFECFLFNLIGIKVDPSFPLYMTDPALKVLTVTISFPVIINDIKWLYSLTSITFFKMLCSRFSCWNEQNQKLLNQSQIQ